MRRIFSHLLVIMGLMLTTALYADEVIHFDCDKSASGTVSRVDLLNDPPNNLQCLKTEASVLGKGTVHPQLEMRSPQGHRVVKVHASDPNPTVYLSRDGETQYNNCLEYLDQGRRYVDEEFGGAWGFGDVTACHGETCSPDNSSKAELDFIFHGTTVERFSIRMLDWGDYRPKADDIDQFQTTLTAYNANGEVIDRFDYLFSVDVRDKEETIRYDCVSEIDNSCFKGGDDLQSAGDACNAQPEEPGNLTLAVEGKGITRIELRVPSHGYDPNVGFDTIRFTPE